MKKFLYSLLAVATLVSCGGDEGPEVEVVPEGPETIEASNFTIEATEGLSFAWENESKVSVFRSNTNEKFVYDAEQSVFVKSDQLKAGEALDYVYGVHPYKGTNRVQSGKVKTELIAEQTYVENGVCFEENPMVAVSTGADSKELEFKNLCGYGVVKLYGTAAVKKVAIQGINKEDLAGTILAKVGEEPTVSFQALQQALVGVASEEAIILGETEEDATAFYITLPPVTFEAGYTIVITDSYGNVRKKNFKVDEENPAVTINRNEVTEICTFELKEKLPTKTILDVQFNEDGTATDEGIYGLDVQLMGETTPNTFVYKHKKFKENNIARFHNVRINNDVTKHSYYKVDYSQNVEMMETIADGFALEVVTLATCANWDWWLSPVATDAYRFLLQGGKDNYTWKFSHNNGGGWFTNGTKINTTYEFNKYHHNVYMYDADNMQIQVWHNGELLGMVENVAEFNPGQLLTIGGYGDVNDNCYMQWNGEVALVRMYDQVLEPGEIADKFKDLKLPEASEAPAATYGAPLVDFKWNADGTATNAGTQTDLEVTSKPAAHTVMMNVDGFGNIVKFALEEGNNNWNKEGFWEIDYSANEEFKNKMKDGFTFEFVCVADKNPGDYYCRAAATDTFGCHLRCAPGAPSHYWQAYFNGNNEVWHHLGNTTDGYQNILVKETGKVMESFVHMVCVYNPETKMYYTYYNGHGNAGFGGVGEFNVGNFVGVPCMPGNPGGMQHGWVGKVAIARIYDEPFNVEQILARYNDLQPVIEKLNATIGQ